ncbi:MAG TPA: hypothetical protein VKY39_08780, partial [Aggregatilineales bacterium]|nr:hypothetical protein [Aggregatilineales bacterium]
FYFDTVARKDWIACYDDGTLTNNDCDRDPPEGPGGREEHYLGRDYLDQRNGGWIRYEFTIPGETDTGGVPFYGGRLMVSYKGGNHDTFGWKITIEGRPFLVK